ncbi:MAG: DUF5106 domain-containing protein [Lewinellaceae bacterium]|nr:DUF5106 domain-containing protein [Saprospiraceae bacterium]MCB9311373.1 DUF5106 domain-containing protein [Lewinellaceae bacterium]HRW74646.1 DUF5106 domain-containing protein [Saprospiraceae bacterium]
MLNRLLFLLLVFVIGTSLDAQTGYDIRVETKNYAHDTLYLGFYYGDKQYLKDTAIIEKGKFRFQGEEELAPGMYLILLQPDNSFVQLNINRGKQRMDIKFDAQDPVESFVSKNDDDNQAFYTYIRYLNKRRPEADELRKQLELAGSDPDEKARIEEKLKSINDQVKAFQLKLIKDHPGTLTAALISSFQEIDIPEFTGDEKEVQVQKYHYFMDHYFDHIDFSDERMIRTSFFFQKVNDYVQKHTVQMPDSLIKAVDRVLKLCQPNEEAFKFFLVHFVNVYAKSNIIGMDAVYVHIVDEYYAKGAAPWVDEEQLSKMTKNAASLRPILIGEIAPDIMMQRRDGSKIALHEIKSPYTVLMFWAPDCGHCQKSMPKVVEFYNKFKDKGVELFSVCTKVTDKVPDCWKMVDEKEMDIWINVVDPYLLSKFSTLYDVRSTPQIFILDADKKILLKRLAADQLEDVMQELMDRQEQLNEQFK